MYDHYDYQCQGQCTRPCRQGSLIFIPSGLLLQVTVWGLKLTTSTALTFWQYFTFTNNLQHSVYNKNQGKEIPTNGCNSAVWVYHWFIFVFQRQFYTHSAPQWILEKTDLSLAFVFVIALHWVCNSLLSKQINIINSQKCLITNIEYIITWHIMITAHPNQFQYEEWPDEYKSPRCNNVLMKYKIIKLPVSSLDVDTTLHCLLSLCSHSSL